MKFKKGLSQKRQTHKKDDKVVISSEYYTNEIKPSYLCSFCNQTLVRLTDAGQNNTSSWCRSCSVEFDPESENLRKESKLIVPDRNQEAAVTSIQTNMADKVAIRHEPEIKGSFKALRDKGLKITNYKEDVG
jgi:hypothetical protein